MRAFRESAPSGGDVGHADRRNEAATTSTEVPKMAPMSNWTSMPTVFVVHDLLAPSRCRRVPLQSAGTSPTIPEEAVLDISNVCSYNGDMVGVDVVGLVTVLTATDPAACDQAALADLVATSQQVRGWLDSYEARIAVRADVLAGDGSGDPAAVVLADRGRRSGRAARDAARRGSVCADLPGLFDALASGACRPVMSMRSPGSPDGSMTPAGPSCAIWSRRSSGRRHARWSRCSNGRCATSNASSPANPAPTGCRTRRTGGV